MSIVLDEDESFSMSGYSESDGYQRIVLRGYLTERRSDGLYAAPLIPQLFYGYDGNQLSTWRQYIPAGSHTILSRSGGSPSVPHDELYWRKVESAQGTYSQYASFPPSTQPSTSIEPSAVSQGLAIIALTAVGAFAILGFASLVKTKKKRRKR